jgi:hypothetical protein
MAAIQFTRNHKDHSTDKGRAIHTTPEEWKKQAEDILARA